MTRMATTEELVRIMTVETLDGWYDANTELMDLGLDHPNEVYHIVAVMTYHRLKAEENILDWQEHVEMSPANAFDWDEDIIRANGELKFGLEIQYWLTYMAPFDFDKMMVHLEDRVILEASYGLDDSDSKVGNLVTDSHRIVRAKFVVNIRERRKR